MLRSTAALLALSTLACSTGTPTWQEQETKNHPRQHVMVQFTDASLHPSTAQLLEGGTVSWVNYASLYQGSVVFSDAVAAAFTCDDLRPNWMKTGTGYQSIPITMGGGTDDVQWGGVGAMGDPQVQLQGKIVVE